ncbi:MAG: MarP family serine protease [Actinomycetota bacterium]
MNIVDLLFILIASLTAYRGYRRGLLGLVFELGGGFVGLLAGVALGPRIADAVTESAGLTGVMISVLTVFVLLTVGQTIGYIIGQHFASFAHKVKLGPLNQVLGALGGVLLAALTFWLIGSLVAASTIRPVNRALARSVILQALDDSLPPPPNLLSYFSQYLNTSGFPQVFAGLPRPIGPPVDLPNQRTARRAIDAAAPSTVRITVPACGGNQLGSGWIVSDQVVVTNAHVVAGGDGATVQTQAEEAVAAEVVRFDPRRDVAVLRLSESVSAPPLPLETRGFGRGEPGATLGYPGNGNGQLDADPAAVQGRYEALGKDIYGRSEVSREVYELRADVTQGESGGPFVLPDGRVAGVIFAASTTDSGTGYALTGAEVEGEIEAGISSNEPVSAGRCTR